MALSEEQIQRYSRHIILSEVGGGGQERLLSASVFCVGAGGLGCPVGLYLAASGVGRIGVIDADQVDLTNLQRQIAHRTCDVGQSKVKSLQESLQAINPECKVETYEERLTSENVMRIIEKYDIVVDGSDNFATRFLVNDACFFASKPLVSGSVFRFEGQVATFGSQGDGPCYRCIYAEPPPPGLVPSCQQAGILGAVVGTIGTIQATETVKLILGIGKALDGRLIIFDALAMKFREVKAPKDPDCPLCGKNPTIKKLLDYEISCSVTRPTPE